MKHPVHDFLFTYYSHGPAQLRRWHPGYGVALADAPEYAALKGYVDGAGTAWRTSTSQPATCRRVADPPPAARDGRRGRPNFGCFGLHEWAMVYRLAEDETRHADWPLRLGAGRHRRGRRGPPDRLLALRRLPVLHRRRRAPLNTLAPGPRRPAGVRAAGLPARRDGPLQARLPAHADDRLRPGRRLLRARPGHPRPRHARVAVRPRRPGLRAGADRDAEGKAEYAAAQREFAERGAPLRARLVEECERLLAATRSTDEETH